MLPERVGFVRGAVFIFKFYFLRVGFLCVLKFFSAMIVLVGCEESQEVCKAFRNAGHEAYSNDLQDCSGGKPEWHLKMDFFEAYEMLKPKLTITFQPCTNTAVSGAKHFWYKRDNGEQEKSIRFFFEVWKISNCSENPIGIMAGGYIKEWFPVLYKEMFDYGFPFKATQIIQPYEFGHTERKSTCLWLRGVPKLKPTKNVFEEMMKLPYKEYAKVHSMPPGKDRARLRSKTYTGIADAMANQWGSLSVFSFAGGQEKIKFENENFR